MPRDLLRASFVGCGRVGRSLGRLFRDQGSVEIVQVIATSPERAAHACAAMGAGEPAADVSVLSKVDVIFVLTSDAAIPAAADELARRAPELDDTAIVHASGALSSDVLAPVRRRGASIASVHPIRSFPGALVDDDMLSGVVCGAEGDAHALDRVRPLFEGAGARLAHIEPGSKRLYHAAAVMACNHLVGLIESSLAVYRAAGVDRALALDALEPLVRGTVDNVFTRGPAHSLSGPIVRGEDALVAAQLEDLGHVSPELREIYRLLARPTLELAREAGGAPALALDRLARVLADDATSGDADTAAEPREDG